MGPYEIKRSAAATANVAQLRKIYGITCAFSGCIGKCEDLAGKYGDHEFSACPISVLSSRRWSVVLELFGASKVSPISGWPEDWAPWVVQSLSALRSEIDQAQARAQREAMKNGS